MSDRKKDPKRPPTFRRLKIVSAGYRETTKVIDAETGEPVDGVIGISWSMDEDSFHATATIKLRRVMVEVDGDFLVRTDYRFPKSEVEPLPPVPVEVEP